MGSQSLKRLSNCTNVCPFSFMAKLNFIKCFVAPINVICWSEQLGVFASGGVDKHIKVWKENNWKDAFTFREAHQSTLLYMA